MIGRTLGHYRVLSQLGAGGMGVVYRARDERLERDVALKVLPAGALGDDAARKRFRREALALSQLNHPNIAMVHDFDTQDGVDFLVLEHIEGETLDERLVRGPLAERELAALGVQLATGLAAAHQRGVVHRDLKPANLRVTSDGRLKILDFGLARLLQPAVDAPTQSIITEPQQLMGSLPYMAPEQLSGEQADARSDLYAAGTVLYEMTTGQRAFAQSGTPQLMYAIMNEPPPPPSALNRHVSPALESLLLKALEKDPELRYQSARDLKVDLERLRTPSAAVARSRRRGAVARVPIWVIGVAALVATLSGLWTWNPGGWRDRWSAGSGEELRSLAVLPLANLSGDPGQEYFADGMTDELITSLGKISALRVISRSSVMAYKGTRKPLREIARALRVGVVLEGSVLRAQDRVRITAQLIQVATGKVMWSERYERDLRDVLTLQGEVALEIAGGIRANLTPQEHTRLSSIGPVNPEAYQAYLRGRYAWNQYTPEGFREAEDHFRRAIAIDPTYAPAWAGMADAAYGTSSIDLAPNVAIPRARAAALKALELDESLSEAHTSAGIVRMVYDWDWAGAERAFDRAISLKPGDANAHLWRGHLLVCVGRFEDGLAEIRRALDLDPLSSWISASLGYHLYLARRYQEAAEHLTSARRMDPEHYVFGVFLGLALEQQGDHSGAVAALERAVERAPNNDNRAQLAHAYGSAGRRQDAERVIVQLIERRKQEFVPAGNIALAHAGLGNKEESLRWLDLALEDHSEFLIFLKVEPGFDPLRSDPRFDALLRRVKLAP